MKLLVINETVSACRECVHRYTKVGERHQHSICNVELREIPDASTIPSWCPLPDAGESLPPQAVRQTATAIMERAEKERLPDAPAHVEPEPEPTYPCQKCGVPRTIAEGGTTFTVCDACWTATSAPVEKRCGTCRWWAPTKDRSSIGECLVRLPEWVSTHRVSRLLRDTSGTDCPTWEEQ